MSSLIGIINGKRVYSDKAVASIVDSRVTFSDGSWCDVNTGEVVNNGSGSISIGNPGAQTEKTTVGPTQYACTALEVQGVQADLEVVINDGPGCEVTLSGPEGQLKAIKVSERNGTLIIVSESSGGGVSGVTIISGGGASSIRAGRISSGSVVIGSRGISIGGGNISIGGGSGSNQNEVKIIVKVPKGAAVDLTDVDGKISVGDTDGALRLSMGGVSNIRVGRIGKLRARLSGSSQMDINHVVGDASISVSGSGSINIAGGEVAELTVSLSGMGNVRFGGTAQDADLSVSGMGNVHVATVVNRPRKSMSGMGQITVGNW